MSRFDRITVCSKVIETGIVPVFYHSDVEIAKQVIKACYEGGVKVFEFTNRGDFAHEIFAQLEKWSKENCPDLILGIGSIVEAGTAAMYMQLGANFIVGPMLNSEIFKVCNRRQVAYIPGCATASEVNYAQELGAEIVKIFPGDVVGPGFIKGIKAPMPWSKIMVTGGVAPTEESLKKWFSAGASAVGMGSQLFPSDVIQNKDWNKITEICKNTFAVLKTIKK